MNKNFQPQCKISAAWRMTKATINKVQTFINNSLRRILKIHWPNEISNNCNICGRGRDDYQQKTKIGKRWRWIGHALRKPVLNTTRQALTWNPRGKRKRGRPKNTWRWDPRADMERLGYTWYQIEKKAHDRALWKTFPTVQHNVTVPVIHSVAAVSPASVRRSLGEGIFHLSFEKLSGFTNYILR